MSETLDKIAEALRGKAAGRDLGATVKFDIADEGVVRIVGGEVTTEDGEADCTVSAALDTFQDMFNGDLDPTAAFMTGKIKIDGDMGVAMKLSSLLG